MNDVLVSFQWEATWRTWSTRQRARTRTGATRLSGRAIAAPTTTSCSVTTARVATSTTGPTATWANCRLTPSSLQVAFSSNRHNRKSWISVKRFEFLLTDFKTAMEREIFWTLLNYGQQFFASDTWVHLAIESTVYVWRHVLIVLLQQRRLPHVHVDARSQRPHLPRLDRASGAGASVQAELWGLPGDRLPARHGANGEHWHSHSVSAVADLSHIHLPPPRLDCLYRLQATASMRNSNRRQDFVLLKFHVLQCTECLPIFARLFHHFKDWRSCHVVEPGTVPWF